LTRTFSSAPSAPAVLGVVDDPEIVHTILDELVFVPAPKVARDPRRSKLASMNAGIKRSPHSFGQSTVATP
jgi:hypothetical protein